MIRFEGALSVKAVLLNHRRTLTEIWIDEKKHDHDTAFLIHQAQKLQVPVLRKKRQNIDAVAEGKTHGGIVAFGSSRSMQTLEECLEAPKPFLALLEGIEDPFNLGYALRTLAAAGCSGVLLRPRNWETVEGTIVKSSAGASEILAICFAEDLATAVAQAAQAGCQIYCATRKEAIPYYEADFQGPLLLAVGGEMRGLSQAVLSQSDQNIYIPYASSFRNALNASSALAALSFEIVRQRRK